MGRFDELSLRIRRAGSEIFWLGAASQEQIDQVEALLSVKLPVSYRDFLSCYGGGGVVGAEVSGIEDNDSSLMLGGTVVGDTLRCRDLYNLPHGFVVIYYHDEEVCWCLETTRLKSGECPVVSFNLFNRSVDREIAESFQAFIEIHLGQYASYG